MFFLDPVQCCASSPPPHSFIQTQAITDIASQIGRLSVALTGLTYSYDSFGAVSSQPGLANVTDWTSFAQRDAVSRSFVSTPEAERYSAHAYGLFSAILESRDLTVPGGSDPNLPEDKPIEVASNGSYFYYFREWNPKPKNPHNNLAHKSDRAVEVHANCTYFPLVQGQDGSSDTVSYLNGTTNHTLRAVAVPPRPSFPSSSLDVGV